MKIFSLILFFFLFSLNVDAKREDLFETHSKKLNQQTESKQLDNKNIQELIKKLPNKDSLKKTYKETSNDFTEILKKLDLL